MSQFSARRARSIIFVALLTAATGCGGDSDSGSSPSTPTGPTSPAPPSGVPNISGNWSGTSDFERPNNLHTITTVTLSLTQTDRNVSGTVRFPASGWESWRGTVSGMLSGTVDPEFSGTVTLESEPTTGTGVCSGQMTMNGRSFSNQMRWDAPVLTMSPSAGPTEQQACLGTVRNIAWIFNR